MPDDKKNLLIGLFVLSAGVLVVWMLMFIHPSIGDGGQVIRVRFADIDKVSVGTRVTHAGRPVGEVIALETVPNARQLRRPSERRRVFIYELTLQVDSSIQIYESDEIAVRTSGLLGERSIAIIPRIPRQGQALKLISPDAVLYSTASGSVEDALADMGDLMNKAGQAVEEVLGLLGDNREALGDVISSLRDALQSVDIAIGRMNETDAIAKVTGAADSIGNAFGTLNQELEALRERQFTENFAEIVDNVQEITSALNQPESLEQIVSNVELLAGTLGDVAAQLQTSWPRIDKAIDDVSTAAVSARAMMQSGNELIAGANKWLKPTFEGEGSIGKFLSNDDFYLRINGLLGKANTLMNDLNHYGLLFHLNRGWQRTRTKRANQVAKLQTAGEFRDFFEQELDTMNTSVSRVAMLLAEAEERRARDELLEDTQFSKAFAELLRQVESLGDNIRLYNQDLLEDGTQN